MKEKKVPEWSLERKREKEGSGKGRKVQTRQYETEEKEKPKMMKEENKANRSTLTQRTTLVKNKYGMSKNNQ